MSVGSTPLLYAVVSFPDTESVRTSALWDWTLSIKVPFFPFQKLVLPLLSPEMTAMSLMMARLQMLVSLFLSAQP